MGFFDRLRGREKIIYLRDYPAFLKDFARQHGIANVLQLHASHKVYCANCGVEFSKEALSYLSVIHLFEGRGTIWGATQQGNDFRSGKCPYCGSYQVRIIMESGE
jgi:DNA-directed RNA polymerase subunit RPC12/RpoP